ncbi:hypothetical protein [Dethiothermospora halolimnae]|uniref:hypothetical protein n=1 Tax=Dethiothermospora halolimnae TaxID=3114390 RepID=UPI003CCBADC9
MLEFIKGYWVPIVVILIAMISLIFLYKKGKEDTVRKVILSLVIQAEKLLGSGTGELKYAWVVEQIYKTLPIMVQLIFTRKQIDSMIEEAVEFLKDYLSNGKSLLGYDDEFKKVNFDNMNL